IQNDPSRHENAGCHIVSGAAHDGWGGLHGSAFQGRSGGRSSGELSGHFKSRHLGGTIAMLSVDQFLRLMCVPAVIFAFVVASQISAAVSPHPAMAMASE